MAKVCGIDPGHSGAFGIYDTDEQKLTAIWDMPVWNQIVGRKQRKRYDAVELADRFDVMKMLDVKLIVMEEVGGRPQQSASAGFVFGYGVGLLYMCAIQSRIAIETVTPSVWKRVMRVPKDDAGIAMRFEQIFPAEREQIRGPRGAVKHDRAEASLLAKFGADYLLNSVKPDSEWRMVYQRAGTGA